MKHFYACAILTIPVRAEISGQRPGSRRAAREKKESVRARAFHSKHAHERRSARRQSNPWDTCNLPPEPTADSALRSSSSNFSQESEACSRAKRRRSLVQYIKDATA